MWGKGEEGEYYHFINLFIFTLTRVSENVELFWPSLSKKKA